VATRLTAGEFVLTLRRAGLDSHSGLAREESMSRVAQASSVADLQLQALGEWGVETTPVELLAAYQRTCALTWKIRCDVEFLISSWVAEVSRLPIEFVTYANICSTEWPLRLIFRGGQDED
jgi:hypothetical protein